MTLTIVVPAGMTAPQPPSPQRACVVVGALVECRFATIAAGERIPVEIVLIPTVAGPATITASVGSSTTDPVSANNRASVEVVVGQSVRVSVENAVSPDPALLGGEVTYTVVVTNEGDVPATGVVARDRVPSYTNFTAATSAQGSCQVGPSSLQVAICEFGTLAPGASATMIATAMLPSSSPYGYVSNEADVDTNEPNVADEPAWLAHQVYRADARAVGAAVEAPAGALLVAAPRVEATVVTPQPVSASQLAVDAGGLMTATSPVVTAQWGPGLASSASAAVASASLLGGLLVAEGIAASCSASPTVLDGNATIGRLRLGGTDLAAGSPAPLTVVGDPGTASLVLNEQLMTGSTITVRALHLRIGADLDVVIGEATCGLRPAP